MTKTRIFSLFLALSLLFSVLALPCAAVNDPGNDPAAAQTDSSQDEAAAEEGPPADEETPADPENGDSTPGDASDPVFSVDAAAAMLVEMNSGTIVYEKNADDKVYPASLTKIMTCMLALELCKDLAEEVTVTETALAGLDPDGSTASLQVGEVLTMEDLLYCIMLPSANDACCVVAEHLGGTIDAFVEKMNEKAQALGCTGTHFANPDGLHDDDHYTTARDLRRITEAALQNETFRTIVSTAVYEVPATNLSDKRIVHTTNYLMSTAINPDYYYEKAKGVKTGYTSKAGRCLISTVKQGDVYYLSIVTGCKTIVNDDGSVVYDSFVQTKKLLEYGLTSFSFATVISQLVPVAQVKVKNANVDSVVVALGAGCHSAAPGGLRREPAAAVLRADRRGGHAERTAGNNGRRRHRHCDLSGQDSWPDDAAAHHRRGAACGAVRSQECRAAGEKISLAALSPWR